MFRHTDSVLNPFPEVSIYWQFHSLEVQMSDWTMLENLKKLITVQTIMAENFQSLKREMTLKYLPIDTWGSQI